MSKHLLAIRDDHRTDIQHYTRTLPHSLPTCFFTMSLLQSVRLSSLLFPSHPTTSCSPSQTYTHPAACSWSIPSSLPFCTWFLFEGVHFPHTLGGRGMLSRGRRQMHMFRTFLEALTSLQSIFSGTVLSAAEEQLSSMEWRLVLHQSCTNTSERVEVELLWTLAFSENVLMARQRWTFAATFQCLWDVRLVRRTWRGILRASDTFAEGFLRKESWKVLASSL